MITENAHQSDDQACEPKHQSKRLVAEAQQHLDRGDRAQARKCVEQAIEKWHDNGPAYQLCARLEMPGEPYLKVLQRLHNHLCPATYFETGVAWGRSLKLAESTTRAIGVDPRPCLEHDVVAMAKIFPTTSDLFFERFDVREEIGAPTVDMVFIDGMHLFEFALRDFVNIERFCSPRTVVAIHDCYPIANRVALRQRETGFWTGDVWKVAPCLRECRSDLKIHTVATPPSGLLLITGCDATSTLLADDLDRITATYTERVWDPKRAKETLNLVPNEWDQISQLLPGRCR